MFKKVPISSNFKSSQDWNFVCACGHGAQDHPSESSCNMCVCSLFTAVICEKCKGTGKHSDSNNQCPMCNGQKFIQIQAKRDLDKYHLVNNFEELKEIWLTAVKEPACYDSFCLPKEYPCLVCIHSGQIMDNYGRWPYYFYAEYLPKNWPMPKKEI